MPANDSVLTMYSAELEDDDGSAVLRVPEREVELDTLAVGEPYRVALLPVAGTDSADADRSTSGGSTTPDDADGPPVETGEQLDVEIEDVGEQGDGIARVGPGYVIFVPDADVGDRVTIEVTQVRDTFAFAEVLTAEPVAG